MIARYLAEGPYRFSMAFGRGHFAEFYGPSPERESILKERARWIASCPQQHLAALPESRELLQETIKLAQQQGTLTESAPIGATTAQLTSFLGERWEPDFLLLSRDHDTFKLVSGCVCFPSSWALEEKIGHPIEQIHNVVPSLNSTIGRQIQSFLEKIKPGVCWTRSNWGLTRSPALNQHPSREMPRLDGSVSLEEVFFRVEEQSLVLLPTSHGILFGIRIRVFPLADYARTNDSLKLAHALETMPEPMAAYKGLASARSRIIALLRS